MGEPIGDEHGQDAARLSNAVTWAAASSTAGKAQVGDKTMVTMVLFSQTLAEEVRQGRSLADAWSVAAKPPKRQLTTPPVCAGDGPGSTSCEEKSLGHSRRGSRFARQDRPGRSRRFWRSTRLAHATPRERLEMTKKFRVVIGSDAGLTYKQALAKKDPRTNDRVAEVVDVGVDHGDDDQLACPHVAIAAAELIAAGKADRALLVYGTGLGVAISVQGVPGVRSRDGS